jgi:hypothetical protein
MTDEEERRESEARVRDMLARAALAEKDHDKRVQDIILAPRSVMIQGLAAGAALFGAGAAFATAMAALFALALRH